VPFGVLFIMTSLLFVRYRGMKRQVYETRQHPPTQGRVVGYAATYRKGCMHTLIRQNKRIGCYLLGACVTTKKGYAPRKILCS
jgi:hypothetical protein